MAVIPPPAQRDLFGGALSIQLPSALIDASEFRQVPDTQEVFIDPNSDVSLVIEILERVAPTDPVDAIKFHFGSLAHDNDAGSSTVASTKILQDISGVSQQEQITPVILQGNQSVTKFNRNVPDDVAILVALYRVASKDIDVVFSINIPDRRQDLGAEEEVMMHVWKDSFIAAARSLRIVDYDVFA